MKVILLQNVKGVGSADQVKEVADGYARNFLFPNHLAVAATDKGLQQVANRKKEQAKEIAGELSESQQQANRLEGLEIELTEKVTAQNRLVTPVTPAKIAEALTKRGIKIKKEQIRMKAIKDPGTSSVVVVFKHGLEARVSVIINA